MATVGVAAAKKKDEKNVDKYEPKEKIKDWSELKKLTKDWQLRLSNSRARQRVGEKEYGVAVTVDVPMAEWIPHPSLDSLRAGGGEFDALHPFFGFCDFLTNWLKFTLIQLVNCLFCGDF